MKDISKLKKEVEENLGKELTGNQLWTLVKLCKHVRLRCKNNAAFNNFMNSMFGDYARFSTVTKTRKSWKTGQEESYPGLSIVVKNVEAPAIEDDED